MSQNAKATICLKSINQKQTDTLSKVLTPETISSPTHRSNVKIEKNGNVLLLIVEAEDTVALRATLNAYLRWINSTLNTIDTVEKNQFTRLT